MLHEELAEMRQLHLQHKRDMDLSARPSATAGAGSSSTAAALNDRAGHSDARKRPRNGDHTWADDDDDAEGEIRIPPPDKKESLTIKVIQDYLGLTDSREDHLKWLDWRVG